MTMQLSAARDTTVLWNEQPTVVTWRLPATIFLSALAVSLAVVFVAFRNQSLVDSTFDPYWFGAMGQSFAHGEGWGAYGTLIDRRAPLYPAMIGAIYYVFGDQPMLIYLAQALLMAATSVIVFQIGRRMFNVRTGVIAAFLVAFNPMLLRYVGDLQLEPLLTFFFTACVWAAVRFYARPTVAMGLLVGATAALASLTKSVALPFPILLTIGVIGLGLVRHQRISWKPFVAMFAAMAVLIAPWTIRNYFATGGHFVLLSSGTSDAFLRGYVFSKPEYATLRLPPYEYAENESDNLFRSITQQAGVYWCCQAKPDFAADDYRIDQVLNQAAEQKLLSDPADFVRKFVTGLFTFWYQMTSLTNSILAGGLAIGSWALAAVGLVRSRREGQPSWLLILPAIYLNIFLAALLALGRYSVPILPPLLVVSAFGLDTLLNGVKLMRAKAS